MLGLEVADDVTAERRRSSRFIFVIRPFRPKVKTLRLPLSMRARASGHTDQDARARIAR
jgi:hypothetical protein